jgi:hypothetical protein
VRLKENGLCVQNMITILDLIVEIIGDDIYDLDGLLFDNR